MWFYEWEHRPFGPVSIESIAEALRAGKINATTLVWREGMPDWKRLAESELGVLLREAPAAVGDSSASTPPPVYVNNSHRLKINPEGLSKLFWWWLSLTLCAIPLIALPSLFQDQTWVIGLICLFELPLIAGTVLQYILIYRFWQIIQDGFARTTPGKAVGFSFIPFFNFYWIFVIYYGLARDMNSYIERHHQTTPNVSLRRTHPAISLTYLIVIFAWILIYLVFIILFSANLFLGSSDLSELSSAIKPINYFILIYYVIEFGLMIGMNFDFYLSAKDILAVEKQQ